MKLTRRSFVAAGTGAAVASLATPALWRTAQAAAPIQLVSHRYPALEYYAQQFSAAAPEGNVNQQLMPFDKAFELMNIALSSKSNSIDVMYVNESMTGFMRSGWLRPLNDLWEKYSDEFNLKDINPDVLKHFTYEGKIYGMPLTSISHLFFYRKDVLDEAGKQPPKTIDDYIGLASELNSPMRSGTISCLRGDSALGESHWYINALGDGWFDDKWEPVFNNEKGIHAITRLKEATQYAQQGFMNAHNDECTIAMQQDIATMGLSWTTRATAMDNPEKSAVVGKVDFVAPPQGHGRLALDGYAISAFSTQDPDTLFRMVCQAASDQSMRGATGFTMVPRVSILADPEVQKKYRHYPAGMEAISTAVPFPKIPEFFAVGEFIRRRILQAVAGEMEVAAALNTAAEETRNHLAQAGYYK
ncbi:extracellular solute-binding protein [Rhizobium sp. GN54]|uniref:extracellular solute-binding protein n=1 Tax=Rhizobium sp. GN54 TaxID=2898150 RepID=UPI001E2D64B4|nr:extracellular solute-binding protein [Rhizobium sp. GN54]MCD2183751.1 extracellular solute-binding protein [Rhizobium sp. GN54]